MPPSDTSSRFVFRGDAAPLLKVTNKVMDRMKAIQKASHTGSVQIQKSVDRVQDRIEALNERIKQVRKSFPTWALSIMFLGMALQRVFRSIWRFGTRTFQDVMHSVEGTVTGFDRLQGSLSYLGFVVGQALEPLADMLVPIIDRIREWIEENPRLFRWITAIAGALGTLFVIVGILGTSIPALIGWLAALYKGFQVVYLMVLKLLGTKLGAWFVGITKAAWALVAPVVILVAKILLVIAVIAVVVAIGMTIGFIWENILTALKIRWEQVKLAVEAFWEIIKFGVRNAIIDFKLIGNYLKLYLGEAINWVGDRFAKLINTLIDGYNAIARRTPGLPTINYRAEFEGVNLSGVRERIDELKGERDNLRGDFQNVMNSLALRFQNLQAQLALNREDAWENIKDGWADVFNTVRDMFSGDDGSIVPQETNNYEIVIDNSSLQSDPAMEELIDELMARIEERLGQ